jgi:hypothetical protein
MTTSLGVDSLGVDSLGVDSLDVEDTVSCACTLVTATVASAVTLTIDRAQAFARRRAILDKIIKVPLVSSARLHNDAACADINFY